MCKLNKKLFLWLINENIYHTFINILLTCFCIYVVSFVMEWLIVYECCNVTYMFVTFFFSEAFYRFDDLQNAFCYSQALNNSFGNGGGLFCTFQPRDIIMHCGQLDEDWRSEGNTPKTLVTKPGLQPNSNILVLNPDHYVNTKGENVSFYCCQIIHFSS